jgi:phosphate/sulfate permease
MNTTDREASSLLALVALALFIGTLTLWLQIIGVVQW